jgi:uncharacterized protein YraI
VDDGSEAAAEPAPRNPRQVRARRRRRRRQFGTLLFVLVAGAVLAAAYLTISGNDDSPQTATSTAPTTTTTVAPPFMAAYKVTTGINVRQAPGTTSPTVAVVEQGHEVTVVCVIEGESVNASSGPNTQWLKVAGPPVGYVSAAYVAVGDDLNAKKIPACPAA